MNNFRAQVNRICLKLTLSLVCFIPVSESFKFAIPPLHKNTHVFASPSTSQETLFDSYAEATSTLVSYTDLQNKYTVEDGSQGMGGGTSASRYWDTLHHSDIKTVAGAVSILATQADVERNSQVKKEDGFSYGRLMLGICAGDTNEGIQTLKEWVAGLKLPKGLLHGMDLDGVPLEINGAVYIKYSTGGAMTFSEMRRSKRGFDALWRPGDAVLETYDGDFRGVYFNVELEDEEFRQYGVLPLDLFHTDE